MRNTRKWVSRNSYILPSQIELITGMDCEAAQREHDYILRSLGTGSKHLMIKQVCSFLGLDCKEVVGLLTPVGRAVESFIADDDLNNHEHEHIIDHQQYPSCDMSLLHQGFPLGF